MSYFDELDKIWGKASSSSSQPLKSMMGPGHTRRWLIAIGALIVLFIFASISKSIYSHLFTTFNCARECFESFM